MAKVGEGIAKGRPQGKELAGGRHGPSRFRTQVVPVIVLGLVAGVGSALIDWPPFAEVRDGQYWGFATVVLLPVTYLLLWLVASRVRRGDVVAIALGLAYGGVLWAQTIFDLAFLNPVTREDTLEYLADHAWDLFAAAALVGVVGYFSAGPNRIVRMASLALVLALVGTLSGASEAQFLWARSTPLAYPYWVLAALWTITGAWYGICVGFRPPSTELTRALRGE